MRITAGKFGGRRIKVPSSGALRPTQDRVREAFFSMVQFEISSARFLDLFAGSGAVGLEALSRGASSVVAVEADRRHSAVIAENARTLGCSDSIRVVTLDAYAFLSSYSLEPFTMVFADPPYALGEEKGYEAVLETMRLNGVVAEGGVFAAEMTSSQSVSAARGWQLVRDRVYGKTRLCLWRRTGE